MKKIYALSILSFFLTSIAFAETINLPQTGQTKCYDTSGAEIPCIGTGQDGEIQAGVSWPSPRFTNPDGTTPINGDVVLDQLTGLMWTKNANLPVRAKTWWEALDYVAGMNLGIYSNFGHTDWRLPNIRELSSFDNYTEVTQITWLETQGFLNIQFGFYWTSTVSALSDEYVWVYPMSPDEFGGYVWPVRGGQDNTYPAPIWKTGQTTSYYPGDDGDLEKGVAWPNPRFLDNGNGTVTDNLTGLMWTKNSNLPNSPNTWQQALDYVAGMNAGIYPNYGCTDWHLPNITELGSLIDFSNYYPALPASHPFINVQTDYYWSSTSYAPDASIAWAIDISDGVVVGNSKYYSHYYVWPVRGGQVQPTGCTTWTDVISKYNAYVSGQATWTDVINCYTQYAS